MKSNLIERDKQIHFFSILTNTMDKAKELARKGALSFTVVVAEEQTKGRGRLNRNWLSEKGGLWFTIILRPELPPTSAYLVNFAASLSLARIIKQEYGLDVSIKWPNDILLKDKKLAGLLSEMGIDRNNLSFVNIGIGINVNNNPEIEQPKAISIKQALRNDSKKEICKINLLHRFIDEFEKESIELFTVKPHGERLMEKWKQMTSTIGKYVRIETVNDVYEGIATEIDITGALIIMDNEGNERRIIHGDCFYQN